VGEQAKGQVRRGCLEVAGGEQRLVAAGVDAHAAVELIAHSGAGVIIADGIRLIDDAMPLVQHLHGDAEFIVDCASAQRPEQIPPDGEHVAVHGHRAAGLALPAAEGGFIAPVQAGGLGDGGSGVPQGQRPDDDADGRVGEAPGENAQAFRFVTWRGVAEHDDLTGGVGKPGIHGGHLPAANRLLDQSHATRGELAYDIGRAVGAAVINNQDLQPVARVVQGKAVVELAADDIGLIMGRDKQGEGWQVSGGRLRRGGLAPRAEVHE